MSKDPCMCSILDLGCGTLKHEDSYGLDIRPESHADAIWDLDKYPYPLPSNHYELVFCLDIIEHLKEPTQFIHELHRVCAPDAIIEIKTPHFSSWYAYNDPTHRRAFGLFFLDHHVKPKSTVPNSAPMFEIVSRRFLFQRWSILARLFGVLANWFPRYYERRWCFMCPCENVHIHLRVLK